MAELNARVIAKASGTTSEEPLAADLVVAELAVNTADGKLFTKHTDGSVVTISGGGGGGAVDSVNGETGAVSLGIQEMDDFGLNLLPGAKGIQFDFSNENGNVDSQYNGASTAGFLENSGNRWFIYNQNGGQDGTVPVFVVGDEYTFYHQNESVTLTCSAGSTLYSAGGAQSVILSAGSWPAGWLSVDPNVNNGAIYVDYNLLDPKPVTGVTIPLAQGDILQWDNADQKFKPAQYISLGTLQTEVAASTDFADFQSRIAAL